ncbi:MAG: hypothetical protein HOP12_02135 [Candidatus Eisenbacteria bacterium]|uniref:Spermidine synthase n=1 Tax=Eiseniibacteriota bacterium TaxID=2212470 RepID=A0A849SNE9_UNCEI|nr:hypothetical protein [Candidatus Eisenbacteria bacterium]
MIPWVRLGEAIVPGQADPMILERRGDEYVIRVGSRALMGSRAHGSEAALAEWTCVRIADHPDPRVLIGGLGMGFTLAAALRHLPATARVVVAELVPAVVDWNRGALAHLADRPLDDPRVEVFVGDVAEPMRSGRSGLDAILLDVDNGPTGLTRSANDALYSLTGLRVAFDALKSGGVLGVWSVQGDPGFTQRLEAAGFQVEERSVRARVTRGGRHTSWLATRTRFR